MYFIGQHHIMNQLKFMLPQLYSDKSKGANILLRGRSGFGKTEMAQRICKYLAGYSYESYLGENTRFRFVKRVIFIDEIHTVADLERFYGIMDSGLHVFVFATNHDGNLPEAFMNRCFQFILSDYDLEELVLISMQHYTMKATEEQHKAIVEAANRNPRTIRSIGRRLAMYFSQNPLAYTKELDFSKLISEIFMINDGLDVLASKYISTLRSVGGTASIDLLKNMLHIDNNTLRNEVEPILLGKNLIRITSKGRSLVNG